MWRDGSAQRGKCPGEGCAPSDWRLAGAWLAEQLTPKQMADFVAQLEVAGVELADQPVARDLAELLMHLQ